MAKGRIEQEIALKVTGAKDVKDAAKLIDDLDGKTAEVEVGVDADQAAKDIKSIAKLIEGLSEEDQVLVLRARTDQAERDIKKFTAQLGRATDEKSVQIKVEAIGNARRDLEDIQAEMARIDGQSLTVNVDTTGAAGGVRRLGSEADQSRSVLANMVGNATQDLGALGGVAGTAGVALGQLGEYAAEGNINLGNLAKVAGPMAGLALATAAVSAHMEGIAAEKAFRSKLVDDFADAIRDADTVAESLLDTLKETSSIDFSARGGGFLDLGRETKNLLPFIEELGLTWEQVVDDITDAGARKRINEMTEEMVFQGDEGERLAVVWNDYADGVDQYGDAWRTANAEQEIARRLQSQAAAAGVKSAEQIEATADALRDRAEAQKEADEQLRAGIETIQEWAQAQQEAGNEAATALDDAQASLIDMGSTLNDMARRESAISDIFDLGNAPIETLEAVTGINEAIRDLGEFIEAEGVPDLFDPNDVDAQPYLAKIRSLRGPIQEAVGGAFATGGPAAATATANAYVTQVVESLRGKLTRGEVEQLLGLTDIEAKVRVAVDEESMREAELLLETFTGLAGRTPWSAEVALALASGELSAQAANLLIARELEGIGVDVPATLIPPDAASRNAALAEANRWTATHPVDMQANVDDPSIASLRAAREGGQDYADVHPIRWPSQVMPPTRNIFRPFAGLFDQGGTVGPVGGIAGEKGPEILDGRYLAVGPTYVPPGTKVTSRRRTELVLRRNGGQQLRRYDNGGVVAGPRTVNINVNAAVVGNRFDVTRAVMRAEKDADRLYGTRR